MEGIGFNPLQAAQLQPAQANWSRMFPQQVQGQTYGDQVNLSPGIYQRAFPQFGMVYGMFPNNNTGNFMMYGIFTPGQNRYAPTPYHQYTPFNGYVYGMFPPNNNVNPFGNGGMMYGIFSPNDNNYVNPFGNHSMMYGMFASGGCGGSSGQQTPNFIFGQGSTSISAEGKRKYAELIRLDQLKQENRQYYSFDLDRWEAAERSAEMSAEFNRKYGGGKGGPIS